MVIFCQYSSLDLNQMVVMGHSAGMSMENKAIRGFLFHFLSMATVHLNRGNLGNVDVLQQIGRSYCR